MNYARLTPAVAGLALFALMLAGTAIGANNGPEPVLDSCGLAIADMAALAREELDGGISPATVAQARKDLVDCLNGLINARSVTVPDPANNPVQPRLADAASWYVNANWGYDAGGTVTLAGGTKGYPNNVGGYLHFTHTQAQSVADLLNSFEDQPSWYPSPAATVTDD